MATTAVRHSHGFSPELSSSLAGKSKTHTEKKTFPRISENKKKEQGQSDVYIFLYK